MVGAQRQLSNTVHILLVNRDLTEHAPIKKKVPFFFLRLGKPDQNQNFFNKKKGRRKCFGNGQDCEK
jgi:hypothetical protein